MSTYRVPVVGKINSDKVITVKVPGSKSITNRALLIAAMAEGKSVLKGCLYSDDSKYFLKCLSTLGFEIVSDEETEVVSIVGTGGVIPNKNSEIYVGSAGTAARFLVAMLAFSEGEYVVDSSEQMKKRPMMPLIETLRTAGAEIECLEQEGHFPLKIRGIKKDKLPSSITVNIDKSSQFLSALLIAAGALCKEMEIKLEGSHGMAYIDMTVEMMKAFGVAAEKKEDGGVSYLISGKDCYLPREYEIEPDMSAAAYFYGLAAVTGAKVMVSGVHNDMLQGDVQFLDVLRKMGCASEETDYGIVMQGPKEGRLKGEFTIDMSSFSDQALTLSAIAPYTEGKIEITGISHIRLQECDRINAIIKNLDAMGIKAEEKDDGVVIYGGKLHEAAIETFDDHRVAMAFSLSGLRTEGISIINPECCAKTFREYFNVLDRVCIELRQIEQVWSDAQ